ncbi:hypothetical protein O3P69_001447 [Scylla paramamosain]|uniref:AAA+ ATPase domain-containing protein n=1 Tax=Scylla paramamosain TaxID=85552 RepID=A0AAW0V2K9_SCYPA
MTQHFLFFDKRGLIPRTEELLLIPGPILGNKIWAQPRPSIGFDLETSDKAPWCLRMAPTASGARATPEEERALKLRAREDFSTSHGTQEGMMIRKLKMRLEHKNDNDKVQLMSLGQKTNKPTKVILLVGATGTGKTTLINAMVNYIFRVEFTDDFRLVLIDDKNAPKRSQAESQTDLITAYVFNQLPGMPFDYNYVLIDTPGFGDTRGIQRDREMMKQLETFLKQDYGIDQVDGVGFVTPASAARLTQTQRYVYDGLSSMFGKDIKDNIYVMATFADAKSSTSSCCPRGS